VKASSEAQHATSAGKAGAPFVPAEADARGAFAARELAERSEQAATYTTDAPGAAAPGAAPRDPLADAADASAIARFGLLSFTWLAARRRPGRGDVMRERRARVDSRAQRVGQRLGPRLGLLVGDWLLFVGLAAEAGCEAIEDALDDLARATDSTTDGPAPAPNGGRP
jgi:hypothetical protein